MLTIGSGRTEKTATQISKSHNISELSSYLQLFPYRINPYADQLVSFIETRLTDGSLLDAGCGSGWITRYLSDDVGEKVAIDNDPQVFQRILDAFPSLAHNVHLSIQDVRYTGLRSNSFDNIVSIGLVPLVQPVSNLFEELFRLSKSGGNLFITVPNSRGVLSKDTQSWIGDLEVAGFKYQSSRDIGCILDRYLVKFLRLVVDDVDFASKVLDLRRRLIGWCPGPDKIVHMKN